jgi:hypothetical protein
MKEVRWYCERCNEQITADRTTFTTTGAERLRRPEWDLFGPCAALLWEWVDARPNDACAAGMPRAARTNRTARTSP